jgi:hypothetical protein
MPVGYAPPAGNAVNLNFTGAYTPPAGNALILNFFNTVAYTLAADPGSYAITGTAAALKAGHRLFAYQQLIPGLNAFGSLFTDLSGWTVTGLTSFTLTNGSAVLVDSSGGSGVAYRAIAVNPGQQYTLEGYLVDTSAPMGMAVGTTAGGQQLGSVLSFANGTVFTSNPATNPAKSITFTAPVSGTVYVSMFLGTSGQGRAAYLRMEQAGRYQLSGTDVSLLKTGRIMSAVPGVYAVTGSSVALKVGRLLPVDPGIYTQVRTSARLLFGRRLPADPGTYSLTGGAASLSYIVGRFVHTEGGVYSINGSPARLLYGRKLIASTGAYSLNGAAASWVYRRMVRADPGTYALVGSAVTFRIGHRLKVDPGTYALIGADANLISRRMTVDAGTYALNGTAARLLAGKRLQAAPGVYAVAGSNALLLYARRLVAVPGSYALTGAAAGLRVGRRLTAAAGVYALLGLSARLLRGFTVHAVPGVYAMTWATARVVPTRRMLAEAGVYRTAWPDVALTATWRPRGPRAIGVGFAASRYLAVAPQNRRVAVEPQTRYIAVEPAARRYAAVEPRDMEPEGGSMLQWPEKDPNEVLDYELDWAQTGKPRLETGETLLSSTWNIVEGDVVIDAIQTTFTAQGLSTLWLSGGTPNTKCILLNRVTTSKGRTYDKSVVLRVKDH